MNLPDHKTKIVATIGPASDSADMIARLARAGMDVARLNFSHGDFGAHAAVISRIRTVERATGKRLVILADLPGPKMRIGQITPEPIELRTGSAFALTTEDVIGTAARVSVSLEQLPAALTPGAQLFLNDGLIQLRVERVTGPDILCRVVAGGELRSRKGLNLPGISLGMSAFTDHDRACLDFALRAGVDAVSQSFVERASDIDDVRAAARSSGREPFIIAKIERAGALDHYDEILAAADGIMVARGDLGVEVPIERIAVTQKALIARANLAGKPVITATQMLESMVTSRLPTRAEATDVANAILDGTDCVMLSEESAMGRYPEEAVGILARIAAVTEPHRRRTGLSELRRHLDDHGPESVADQMAELVEHALDSVSASIVVAPTHSGRTPRVISRSKPRAWIIAASLNDRTLAGLVFSYGVHPVRIESEPDDWRTFVEAQVRDLGVIGDSVLLVAGPSAARPSANHRIEIMRVNSPAK